MFFFFTFLSMKRSVFIFLIFIINILVYPSQRLPWLISTDEQVYYVICRQIAELLRSNTKLGIVPLYIFNGNTPDYRNINNKYMLIMKNQQHLYNYSVISLEQVALNNGISDVSFIETRNENEIINFCKINSIDTVLIGSITVIDTPPRQTFDTNMARWVPKRVALLQGNIFNVETRLIAHRFSYYLLID